MDLIPGWRTKIPHGAWDAQIKKERKEGGKEGREREKKKDSTVKTRGFFSCI